MLSYRTILLLSVIVLIFMYVNPLGARNQVRENENLVFHTDVHDNSRFSFVSCSDPNQNVHVYGTPTILGKWESIHMVRDPIATHREIVTVRIGKSTTESRTTTFQYSWEITASFDAGAFSGSVSSSMKYMMERTSSTTWSEQITRTREIIVAPGTTVITWQYVFEVEQNLSKAVFRSNFLADTSSETIVPDDIQFEL